MKPSAFLVVAALAASCLVPRAARADSDQVLNGTDISDVVKYFSPMVTGLKKSVTIYNWSPSSSQEGTSETIFDAQGRSRRFWRFFGQKAGASNMYGYGLYGAVDPVLTQGYGGGPNWRLLVMDLPVGFRLLDLPHLDSSAVTAMPAGAAQLMRQFGCPTAPAPDSLFVNGGAALAPSCQELVKKVFSDILQIDGFAYSYSQTAFKECSTNYSLGYRAFVITNSEWMQDSNIRYYTSQSTENLEERTMIETLFLETNPQTLNMVPLRQAIGTYLTGHPTHQLISSTSKCQGSQCVIEVHFCDDQGQCDDVSLPPLPRPGGPLITAAEAAQSINGAAALIWNDLEGKPKATTVSVFLRQHEFGCDGNLPYDSGH